MTSFIDLEALRLCHWVGKGGGGAKGEMGIRDWKDSRVVFTSPSQEGCSTVTESTNSMFRVPALPVKCNGVRGTGVGLGHRWVVHRQRGRVIVH